MKRNARQILLFLLFGVLMASALTACSEQNKQEDGKNAAPPKKNEPVTVTLISSGLVYSDDTLSKMLLDPLKKKYPYITIRYIPPNQKGSTLEDLIARGETPDLYMVAQSAFGDISSLDLNYDMTSLLKQNQFDLNRFQSSAIDALKSMSDKGELFGLPYDGSGDVLHYNKDIFDKFAAPYPKDGMTWDDAMELAKKVSRTDDGEVYLGLGFDGPIRLAYTLSMLSVDAKQNKATIDNEKWRKVFQLGKQIYSIPGNMPESDSRIGTQPIAAFLSKHLAMIVRVNGLEQLKDLPTSEFDWDIAQAPSFKELPNVYSMPNLRVIGITKTSQHKDAALKVIDTLTSDDVQLTLARTVPVMSPLKNPATREQFAADIPSLKNKHVQALFMSHNASPIAYSQYHNEIYSKMVRPAFVDYVKGKKDLNSALRDAQEAAEKRLAELTAQ